jgi:hypothetical protein
MGCRGRCDGARRLHAESGAAARSRTEPGHRDAVFAGGEGKELAGVKADGLSLEYARCRRR